MFFIDTTDGRRPLFSRFNPEGTFDPRSYQTRRAEKVLRAALGIAVTEN